MLRVSWLVILLFGFGSIGPFAVGLVIITNQFVFDVNKYFCIFLEITKKPLQCGLWIEKYWDFFNGGHKKARAGGPGAGMEGENLAVSVLDHRIRKQL